LIQGLDDGYLGVKIGVFAALVCALDMQEIKVVLLLGVVLWQGVKGRVEVVGHFRHLHAQQATQAAVHGIARDAQPLQAKALRQRAS
jgi:hypothetical protein